jgi:hypothetical protein
MRHWSGYVLLPGGIGGVLYGSWVIADGGVWGWHAVILGLSTVVLSYRLVTGSGSEGQDEEAA